MIPQIPDMSARPGLEFPVTVRYPAVSGWGGIIHLPTLRELGVLSDIAYRAGLGVAQMWGNVAGNRGGRYVQAERPRMARNPAGQLVDTRGEVILGDDGLPIDDWRATGVVFSRCVGRGRAEGAGSSRAQPRS